MAADGSLQAELDRGAKALDYHAFAAAPLVLLAVIADARRMPFDRSALDRLGRFVLAGIADPAELQRRTGHAQSQPEAWTLAWLPAYASLIPTLPLPAHATRSHFLGGDIGATLAAIRSGNSGETDCLPKEQNSAGLPVACKTVDMGGSAQPNRLTELTVTSIGLTGPGTGQSTKFSLAWIWLSVAIALADMLVVVVTSVVLGDLLPVGRLLLDSTPPLAGHLGEGITFALMLVIVSGLRGDYRRSALLDDVRWPLDLWYLLDDRLRRGDRADVSPQIQPGHVARRRLGRRCCRLRPAAGHPFHRNAAGCGARREAGRVRPRRVLLVTRTGASDAATAIAHDPTITASAVEVVALDDRADPVGDVAAIAPADLQPDEILLSLPFQDAELIDRVADGLMVTPATIRLAPTGLSSRVFALSHEGVGGVVLARAPLDAWERMQKRAFDIVVATAGLIALAPLLVIVGILVRLDGRGPALFRQTRYGFNQTPFTVSQVPHHAGRGGGLRLHPGDPDDPRITRLGRILRRTNVDELPQLLNVLMGDMSIVGPRPHPVALDDAFQSRIAHYTRRHIVKPGMTGLGQATACAAKPTPTRRCACASDDCHCL